MEFEVTLTFVFDADSPDDAADMFRERLNEGRYVVSVTNLDTDETTEH